MFNTFGCGNGCGGNWLWIIILLIISGGWNNGCGCENDCGCGGNNIWWIIILLIIFGNGFGSGCDDNCGCPNVANNCGCGCN